MSNIPFDDYGEMPASTLTQTAAAGKTVSKAKNVADRDARVATKSGGGGGATKKPTAKKTPAAPAVSPKTNNNAGAVDDDDVQTKLKQTTVYVPLQWHIDPQNQSLEPQTPVGDILKAHGVPDGDVSVLSAHLRQTDSTIGGPMYLTAKGLKSKGESIVNGRDSAQIPYTIVVPRNQHYFANDNSKGAFMYVRGNDVDPNDFADHIGVDPDRLKNGYVPYHGEQGKMAKTHIEVHEGANKDLYDILSTSNGVESMFEGGDRKNPSVVVSRVDHRRVVEEYLANGGYKRAARVNPNAISFELHHFGTKPGDEANESAFDTAAALPGLTQAQREELAHPRASHRVFAEVALTVAHKPAESAAAQQEKSAN